jgi:hypothetical protein
MKKIWMRIYNDPEAKRRTDWSHKYTLSTTQIVLEPREEDYFIDILEIELKPKVTKFYVVLFFFENYFADHYVFDNLTVATACFYENISTRQELRNKSEHQVIEKSYTGEITSSVYEKDYHDRFIWPDKSTRWILKKFDISENS